MGKVASLVYYACVAKGGVILVEYCEEGREDLSAFAFRSLEGLPLYHRRYSHTSRRQRLNCLIENPFVYCAIVDEALGKSKACLFLDQVRDEFNTLLNVHGLPQPHSLDHYFIPLLLQLAAPFSSPPPKDPIEEPPPIALLEAEFPSPPPLFILSSSEEQPLAQTQQKKWFRGNKQDTNIMKDRVYGMQETRTESPEHGVEANVQPFRDLESRDMYISHLQLVQRMWWRSVRLVLILDVVLCLILFGIWLGICRGIKCIRS